MDILVLQTNRDSLLAARFRTKGKALDYLGSERRQAAGDEDFGIFCKNLADKEEAKEKIILSLPASSFFCREVDLPLNDRKKIRDIIPLEFRGETAVNIEDSIFEAVPMEGGRYLVTWGMRKEIAEKIESMTIAGLEPQTVTSAPYHWHSLLPENCAEYSALSDGAALAVFHNREMTYFRALGDGKTVEELKKTMAAVELGKAVKVGHLYLFGEAIQEIETLSMLPDFQGMGISRLPVAGELAEAFACDRGSAPELAGLWALAKETLSGAAVNFRHGDLAYTADFEKIKKNLRLTAILASLLIVLLLAECGFRYALVKKDLDSLNKSIFTIYREVFPNRKKAIDEVAELNGEIKRMGGGAGTVDILETMKKLAEIKGDGVSGFYECEFEGDQVRLKGDADSFQAANDFKMRAGALFATSDVGEIKSRPGGGVTFTFHGTLREAGK